MEYLSRSDRKITKALLTKIVELGYYVAINDGEELVEFENHAPKRKKLSNNLNELFKSVGSTGEDFIRVVKLDIETNKVYANGTFQLIYNNGFDMSDAIGVISDHTCNAVCNDIYNSLEGA